MGGGKNLGQREKKIEVPKTSEFPKGYDWPWREGGLLMGVSRAQRSRSILGAQNEATPPP